MTRHHPTHWLAVALAAGMALLAFEAAGQNTASGALFQGRPALAGAQAGLGAQAGPAQGGIGLQGTEGAQRQLRAPRLVREEQAAACAGASVSAAQDAACRPQAADDRLDRRLATLGLTEPQHRSPM